MKQEGFLTILKYIYLLCVMLLGTHYAVHHVKHQIIESFLIQPHLNGFWETTDQWMSHNGCFTVLLFRWSIIIIVNRSRLLR